MIALAYKPTMAGTLQLLRSRRFKRTLLLIALWAFMAVALYAVRSVLLPFFLAAFLAYVTEPIVRLLTLKPIAGKRIPRSVAVLLLYAGFFALIWLVAVFLIPRLYSEVLRLAQSLAATVSNLDDESLRSQLTRANNFFVRARIPLKLTTETIDLSGGPLLREVYTIDVRSIIVEAFDQVSALLHERTGYLANQIRSIVSKAVGFVFQFFVVLMLTAFLLIDTDRIKHFFFSIVPLEDREQYDDLLAGIDRGLSGVVRGQLMICVINGLFTLIGLLLFNVKYAFLLAVLAAVFSLIPVFGSILSTVPIVVVAFAYSGVGIATGMLLWIVGIHLLEANLLNPKIMGDSAKIHPVLIVLALVAGEHFYGLVGALFAVPVVSIGLTVFRFLQNKAVNLQSEMGLDRRRRVSKAKPFSLRIWREPRR